MAASVWDVPLPNLRALFLPDPGYALVEGDLARADAQVIAWEAGAEDLKTQLRNDVDLHSDNADMLYGHKWQGGRFVRTRVINPRALHVNHMSFRDNAKRWVHATNFGGRERTVASTIVVPEPHVAACQRWWCHERHPAIGQLHRRLDSELKSRKNPVIHNRFGFRRAYVGGDRQSNLLGQALAWIAQSTVAVVINKAMLAVHNNIPEFELLLQIHDSLLGQVRLDLLDDTLITRLREHMTITVPYDDPLRIPVDIKWSAESWGKMHAWTPQARQVA